MPRHPRIQFPGAWYHVTNRGADHQDTYRCDDDRRAFLSLLDVIDERFDVETHAYCLMGNHYHLLLSTPEGGLAKAMQYLDGVYTQRFNRRHGRDGPLFRGRYASGLVDSEPQFLATLRYIHRNPVRACMVPAADRYRWSSDRAYRGQVRAPRWLCRDLTMGLIGRRPGGYDRFVDGSGDDGVTPAVPASGAVPQPVATSSGPGRRRRPRLDLIDVDITVAAHLDVPVGSLTISAQGRANLGRQLAVVLGCRLGKVPTSSVAAHYGFAGPSGVAALLRRFDAAGDPVALAHLQAITATLESGSVREAA